MRRSSIRRRAAATGGALALAIAIPSSPAALQAQDGPTLNFFVDGSRSTVRVDQEFYYDFGVGRQRGAILDGVAFALTVDGDVEYRGLTVMRGPAAMRRRCTRERAGRGFRIECRPTEEQSSGEVVMVLRLRLAPRSGPGEILASMEPLGFTSRLPNGVGVATVQQNETTRVVR